MPRTKRTRTEDMEEGRRKRQSRQEERRAKEAPAAEMAVPRPVAEDPAALLTSSEAAHPANAPRRAQAVAELQRQRGNSYVQRVVQRVQAERDSGRPLDAGTRAQMEEVFGEDLGRVRVHTDPEADRLADELGAEAFATGSDVFFREGAYDPASDVGKSLLTHELTHVMQQTGRRRHSERGPTFARPGDVHEQEADRIARMVVHGVGTDHRNLALTAADRVVQRHGREGGCDTPQTCAAMRQTFLRILGSIDRQRGESWTDAWDSIQGFIGGLAEEEVLSLRTMLGEIGSNPDSELQGEFERRLWPQWQQRITTWLRQQTEVVRRERAAAPAEEEAAEWEEEEEEEERAPEPRYLELPGPPLRGREAPTRLHEVESAGETFRVGDVSGSWQIMAIERDYQGVVTLRVRNRRTREVQGWSLQDWHVQLSIAHVVRSTEAMAAMAEAEVRILYELALPAWIRVPTELAWIGLMCHVHRQELENLVEQISDLNPALDWLHQNAPTSVQVFLVRLATVRVGRATPEAMNPVEIGREIGRALRNLRSIMHLIISITRLARGSVTAGVGASVRAFTGAGALATERSLANLSQTIRDFAGLRALRNLRNVPAGVEALAQREAVGLVADWARSQGLTLDNQTIDQLIRENTNEETGERLVQVLATLRNFMDLSNRLADAIDHQRLPAARLSS